MSDAEPTIVVHPDQCAGSGGCRRAAPRVFGADEQGWVVLLDARPGAERLDEVLEAYDACPVAAIEVLDSRGESLA